MESSPGASTAASSRFFPDATLAVDLLLEAVNTCSITWMVSELLLMRRRSLPEAKWLLPVVILLNVLAAQWTRDLFWTLGLLGQSAKTGLTQLPTWVLCLLRSFALCCGFSWVMYADLKRMRSASYRMNTFLHELWNAVWLTLPIYPVLVIIASFLLLVVESVLECVGLPHAFGQAVLLYGQFYAPLGSVYFILKKDWIDQHRQTTELPLTAASATSTTSRPFRSAGSKASRLLRSFGGNHTATDKGG